MTEMVERVAKAIFGHWREHPQLSAAKQATAWDGLDDGFKQTWLVCARSAIETMREPTDEMNDCESIQELMNGPPTRRWQWIWTSLIDEITK